MPKEIVNILLTMLGVIIGVLISIFPKQIEEKRDYHHKISNYWSLIDYELKSIINVSNKLTGEINSVLEANKSTMMRSLPDTAWKSALTDADFLQAIDQDFFDKLKKMYLGINLLNNTSVAYSSFTTTSGALSTYHQIIKSYHTNILSNLSKAIRDANALSEQVKQQENMRKQKAQYFQMWLDILCTVGFILFIVVCLICLWVLFGTHVLSFISQLLK